MNRQETFRARMLRDYRDGIISNPVYKPYFEWKLGRSNIKTLTLKEAQNIISVASKELEGYIEKYPHAFVKVSPYIGEDPWEDFKGFGDDCHIVSYLYAIEGEMTNLLMMRIFG